MANFQIKESDLQKIKDNENLSFLLDNKFYKNVWHFAIPIYLQMLSTTILTIINSVILRWYEGGEYSAVLVKANFAISLIGFIPTFASLGVMVQMGYLSGRKDFGDAYKVMGNGLLFNIMLCGIVTIGLVLLRETSFEWVNLDEKYYGLATKIYNINIAILWLGALKDIFVKVESAAGNVKLVFINILISSIIDLILSYLLLFYTPLGVSGVAIASLIAAIEILIVMFIYTWIHFKVWKIITKINTVIDKEMLWFIIVIGVPAALETGIFNIVGGYMTKSITAESSIYGHNDVLLNTLMSAQQVIGFGLFMSSAIGQVSSLFVSRVIGSNITYIVKDVTKKTWKLTIIFSLSISMVMSILSYPLLKIYNIPTNVIWSFGLYLFLFAIVQEFGRTMNQIGLSALRTIKFTMLPTILGILSLLAFAWLPILLVVTFEKSMSPINKILLFVSFQTIEENIRGSIYMLLWNGKKTSRILSKIETSNQNLETIQ